MASGQGIGASLPRKEDRRLLHGRGEFVADIAMPGTMDVAFVRSPLAHARIRATDKPAGDEARVYTAGDLAGVRPIVARSGLPGFKVSEQPVLAADRVRYAGELIAACVGETRAAAEDLASRVALDFEELPAVADMLRAREPGAPLLHPEWGDNVFLESAVDADLGDIERRAAVSVTRTFRTARQCMSPIEGRGVLAHWDRRLEMLVLHTACQIPHIVRTGLAECLGLEQGQVRIVVPDVGGGFGYKGILLPEEVVLGWLAMHRDHPVRWIEDRREQLVANANCREHHYVITAHAAADGALLGIDCEAHVDAGAYSSYPFSACLEAAQVASILPGPYVFEGLPLPDVVDGDQQAAHPSRTAEWRVPACASRWRCSSTASHAPSTWTPSSCACATSSSRTACRSTTSRESTSTAATTRSACDGPPPRSIFRRCGSGSGTGRPTGGKSGWGSRIFCEQAAHGTSVLRGPGGCR